MLRCLPFFFAAAAILLSGCATTQQQNQSVPQAVADSPRPKDSTYLLQHRVIPGILFKSGNALFPDLSSGQLDRFKAIVAEVESADYAQQITVTTSTAPDVVFLSFPIPKEVPLCHHAAIVADGYNYRYFTLEKTYELIPGGPTVMLCEWMSDGRHNNYGPRNYTSLEAFRAEILEKFAGAKKAPSPGATSKPYSQ